MNITYVNRRYEAMCCRMFISRACYMTEAGVSSARLDNGYC